MLCTIFLLKFYYMDFCVDSKGLNSLFEKWTVQKKRAFFFFSVLLYLILYFTFSTEYANTADLPNWNLLCSEMLAEKVPPVSKQKANERFLRLINWSETFFFFFFTLKILSLGLINNYPRIHYLNVNKNLRNRKDHL